MVRYIATHYAEPIKSSDIARAADLHMTYAMGLFRRTCGVTFGQYVTQHRIWHAQRLLATTDAMINDIADEAGFGSVSQFHAVFKRCCGIAPHAYRASLKQDKAPNQYLMRR